MAARERKRSHLTFAGSLADRPEKRLYRSFLDEDAPMEHLLLEYMSIMKREARHEEQQVSLDYVQMLLSLFPKRHARNAPIYGKLGVTNRTQAMLKAQEFLLPEQELSQDKPS